MDFEKFDDPNFNPFESKKAMRNSPEPEEKFADPDFNPFETKTKMRNSPSPEKMSESSIKTSPEQLNRTYDAPKSDEAEKTLNSTVQSDEFHSADEEETVTIESNVMASTFVIDENTDPNGNRSTHRSVASPHTPKFTNRDMNIIR